MLAVSPTRQTWLCCFYSGSQRQLQIYNGHFFCILRWCGMIKSVKIKENKISYQLSRRDWLVWRLLLFHRSRWDLWLIYNWATISNSAWIKDLWSSSKKEMWKACALDSMHSAGIRGKVRRNRLDALQIDSTLLVVLWVHMTCLLLNPHSYPTGLCLQNPSCTDQKQQHMVTNVSAVHFRKIIPCRALQGDGS